jgi:FAD/FMN-containing dehydrogenase
MRPQVELRELGARLDGDVVMPGDETWGTARQAWNLAVDQRPIAVVYPESADDVVATVLLAADRGLRIAFNAGGHNAGPIDWSKDTLLLKFERMRGIEIDVAARRARVEAGALAKELAVATGGHGLAYLAGTCPDVGVLGYALGGGLSWMVRKFGLACNSIVAAEVVTADGRRLRTDRSTEPELFWALRGGGGNVAAVTAIEL